MEVGESDELLDLFNDSDKQEYQKLQSMLKDLSIKTNTCKTIDSIDTIFGIIQRFCLKGDEDDWKRCAVCGIYWHGQYIAINTKTFGKLTSKCKSAVNSCLQKAGYTKDTKNKTIINMMRSYPLFLNNPTFLRKWTVRVHHESVSPPTMPANVCNQQQYYLSLNITVPASAAADSNEPLHINVTLPHDIVAQINDPNGPQSIPVSLQAVVQHT